MRALGYQRQQSADPLLRCPWLLDSCFLSLLLIHLMPQQGNESRTPGGAPQEEKKKLKPCCACPETKQPRDAWYDLNGKDVDVLANRVMSVLLFSLPLLHSIIEKGEENCQELIEAHKACMRALGFKI